MNYFNLALLGSPKSRSKLQGPNRANKTIALVVGVLATVFLISFIVRAWTEPSVAPPGGNISAPINIGSTAQTKSGNLTVQGQFNAGGLTVGDSFTASIGCADFKIGNSTRRGTPGRAIVDIGPSEIRFNYGGDWTKASIGSDLDVYGNLRVTGLGNCNTIDAIAGQLVCGVDETGAGGGAPADASYLVLGLNGNLTAERVLLAGSGLTSTDGGANGNLTLNVGAGTGITVAANTVGLSYATKSCAAGQAIQSFDLGVATAPTCMTPSTLESDTLQTVTNRGSVTTQSISANNLTLGYGQTGGTLYLADGATEEGNIERLNMLVGYNDLHLRSNAGNNAAVFLEDSPARVGIFTSGIERMTVDSTGNVFIPGLGNCNTIDAIAGQLVCGVDETGAGGGAPADASYLVLGLNGNLTAERVLLAGSGLTSTDGGANGNLTLNVGAGTGITVAANTVSVDTTWADGRYVNATGDTMTGGLGMSNNNINNINNLIINDPGVGEGLSWAGTTAAWIIDVSPPNRSNADGDLNLYGTANNIHLWRPTLINGNLTVSGNATVSGQNVCLQNGTNCPVGGISCPDCDVRFVNVTGDTMTGGLTINTAGNDKILLRGTQATPHTIWLGDSKGVRFWDSLTGELMRITNTGNVSWLGSLTGGSVPWARLTSFPADCPSGQYAYGVEGTLKCSAPAGGIGGGGTATQVAFFSGPSTISSDVGLYWNNTNKRLGIGNTSPGYKLDVASGGATTARFGTASTDGVVIGGGLGKLTVGTIDPIFDINGEKYTTYVADFAGGVRTETSEIVILRDGKYVIDFDELEKGSDLWLFWQTSNKNLKDFVVLLTPSFEGRVWYEKNGNTITIYGDESGEVSYGLSAPRVDYEEWDNLAKDQSLGGIIVSNY